MIVCLEGIDACGKATQTRLLSARLCAKPISFPDYNSISGQLIGKHLQREWSARFHNDDSVLPDANERNERLDAAVFQSLMLTNRMELAPRIHHARIYGLNLVLDRYWPSGVVYGGADSLDDEWLLQIHQYLPQAHDYILIEIDPNESVKRRPERRDRYEAEPGLMNRTARRYRELWERMHDYHASSWHVVDGSKTIREVHEAIMELVG